MGKLRLFLISLSGASLKRVYLSFILFKVLFLLKKLYIFKSYMQMLILKNLWAVACFKYSIIRDLVKNVCLNKYCASSCGYTI